MTRSILLTGGLGYVGGRVAEWLSRDPDVEIFVTTRNPATAALPAWLNADHCLRLDVLDDADAENACRDKDIIVHFAALNEIDSLKDPEKALLINGLGTQKLVKAAEAARVKRFIYFSTAHIYRSPLEGTITETTLPRPVHPYAISHRTAEDVVLAATTRKGEFRGVVMRLSNSIGAPINARVDRWSLIGNDLCRQAITTGEIRLKTSGIQERDFIALSDVARAVSHMIEVPDDAMGERIFNLGGEKTISIIQLATMIQERCQATLRFMPPVVRPEPRTGEGRGVPLKYSIERLKSTGFRLQGSIEEEIDRTLLFCKDHFPDH
jgi:UDP-glucose 4-epimerase